MTQRHFSPASLIAGLAASAALMLPGVALAEYVHPANNEPGAIVHPGHFQSSKTRAQVKEEAAAALRQEGTTRFNDGVYPAPVRQTGPGKTRQEVVNELLKETPAQRDARNLSMGG